MHQKSDLSDDQLFSESLAGIEKSEILENALSSQHPSTAQMLMAA